jgi:hypothetical protein
MAKSHLAGQSFAGQLRACVEHRNVVVWAVWCLSVISLAAAQWFKLIEVPLWILVVFGLVLLIFGLVWWGVTREKPLFRQR